MHVPLLLMLWGHTQSHCGGCAILEGEQIKLVSVLLRQCVVYVTNLTPCHITPQHTMMQTHTRTDSHTYIKSICYTRPQQSGNSRGTHDDSTYTYSIDTKLYTQGCAPPATISKSRESSFCRW